jgi:cytochrome c oxidase accessory protein FixG
MHGMLESPEHVLSTMERDGSRRWLYPRLTQGRLWQARRIVGFLLIALFVALPYVRIAGRPAVLLDIPTRRFTLFGYTFLPTDTELLALFLIGVFLAIFLATALAGRVWCGWGCPQTVYLEYVFRPIERLFDGTRGHGGKPGRVAGWRITAKYAVYVLLSAALAHVFLAYFVGTERLGQWIRQSPFEHPWPFAIMVGTTGAMLFDFAYFREQMCLIACPYGRLQSVLLDRRSLIVAYDVRRGEPRGKLKKELSVLQPLGDCVDCGACVRTCPTGIDIRNGLQMECIHCTQCIDACDQIMDRIHKPRGLIRYSCQAAIAGEKSPRLRARVVLYPLALIAVASAFLILLLGRDSFDATLLRNFGNPFSVAADGRIQNSYRIKLVNRADSVVDFTFAVGRDVEISAGNERVSLQPGATITQPLLITAERKLFQAGVHETQLTIASSGGEEKVMTCRLLGP